MKLSVRIPRGFSMIELLVAAVIVALLLTAVARVTVQSETARQATRAQVELESRARFAIERISQTVGRSERLVVPLRDNIATIEHPLNSSVKWAENVREQWVPAAAGRAFETAALAVVIGNGIDLDGDGIDDADNDEDGRTNEDPGSDLNFDGAPGIAGIDDDGDGQVDESGKEDDDEDDDNGGGTDEDPLNYDDEDDDGSLGEDSGQDWNQDGASGLAGIDDDGDGAIDESNKEDDDEDEDDGGGADEDWLDTVAYYLSGDELIERWPVIGATSGQNYSEQALTDEVSYLRFERMYQTNGDNELVAITLELTDSEGRQVSLSRAVVVGIEP